MENLFEKLTRRSAVRWMAAFGLASVASPAPAQDRWTALRPIRLIVPFAPGGGADVLARIAAADMGSKLGQPIIVDNKPGASGAIASDYVYGAAPDGYTLLVATADTHSMNPSVNKVNFDVSKFEPVGGIAMVPFVLMGRPNLPARNLRELVALAKTTSLSFLSSGSGAASHIITTMFARQAQIENFVHVPYQGAGPALQALASGQVDIMMVPTSSAVQFRSKLPVYGVASMARSPVLNDVPTLAEQGYAVNGDAWVGVLAPPRTPPAVVQTIGNLLQEVMGSPTTVERVEKLGMTPIKMQLSAFSSYYLSENGRWSEAIRAGHIKSD